MEYVNTTAADGANAKAKIHQPRPGTTSNRWYCVTVGTEVGIFASWYVYPITSTHDELRSFLLRTEAGPHVLGVSGAVHRHLNTKAEAYIYFQHALLLGTVRLVPCP